CAPPSRATAGEPSPAVTTRRCAYGRSANDPGPEVPMLSRVAWSVAALLVLVGLPLPGAAPPTVPAEVRKLIAQLGDDDVATRKAAMKKLEAMGEDVVSLLRSVSRTHSDTDVRLRAGVVAAAIEKDLDGEVRRFTGHDNAVITVAFSPDGTKIVSGSYHF